MSKMNFAIYYAGDGYSTDKKIMGRQSAGKALMKGVARRWKTSEIHGFGTGRTTAGKAMAQQLEGDGFAGVLRWRETPGDSVLDAIGAVYYPGPPIKEIVHARNSRSPTSYSLFGVTHTLSTTGAMDLICDLVLPPFKPWDAMICTSNAALSVVTSLQDEFKAWFSEHTGATRFNPIAQPVIPLGVDAPAFARNEAQQAQARKALGLGSDEVVFLFAGRMSFHAKANPAVFYQALEEACQRLGKAFVCVEAGVYPNPSMAKAYEEARRFLAPSARFIQVDGQDETRYLQAWKAADVFVSLSDNIQETFGLTPLEAMAAGIPVIVSDWDGYKDTVRDGVDGYRIPVTLPPAGAGEDLALSHALGKTNYDYYVGRVSMATVVDLAALTDRVVALAQDPGLRRTLGDAGRTRIQESYDWPVILGRYADLAEELGEIRRAGDRSQSSIWPMRPDPFQLFADYPTRTLAGSWRVEAHTHRAQAVEAYLDLGIARYVLDPMLLPRELILELMREVEKGGHTVDSLVGADAIQRPVRTRALMWLYKLGLVVLKA
jgi:glycosyltransferase involved in cell wall biosynthesis